MKTKPPVAILFDMDGVLIDSMRHHIGTFEAVSKQFGFGPEEAPAHSGALIDMYNQLQKIRPFKADFDEFADTVLAGVFKNLEEAGVKKDPVVHAFIAMLKSHDVPIALGTAAMHRSAVRKLAMVELGEAFEVMVTADDVTTHKPAPDVYIKAAELLGVPRDICIVIDDTAHGLEAGKRAGMKTIGFSKYAPDITKLEGADMIVHDFDELTYDLLKDFVAIR